MPAIVFSGRSRGVSVQRFLALAFVFAQFAASGYAQRLLEAPLHGLVLEGIELTLNQRHDEADSLFRLVAREYPDHPAGHVYRAGAFQARSIDYKLALDGPEFDSLLAKALESSQRMTEMDPDNPWGYFFLGTTLGYDSYARVYRGDWFGGVMKGMSSVREFRKAVERDSSLLDAYVGIGTYTYWRSRKTEFLHWLPFASDERDQGIALVRKTAEEGIYNRYTALTVLASIELDAGRPAKARELVVEGLRRYPENRIFLWERGEAEMLLHMYAEAADTYGRLLSILRRGDESNVYNEMVCLLNLARAQTGMGDSTAAFRMVQQALTLGNRGFPKHLSTRGKEKIDELRLMVDQLSRFNTTNK